MSWIVLRWYLFLMVVVVVVVVVEVEVSVSMMEILVTGSTGLSGDAQKLSRRGRRVGGEQ